MAIVQRLDLRQAPGLVMTPQLQQAIKLLQMSNLELTEFVDREIEQNPLLDRDEAAGEPADTAGAAPMDRRAATLDPPAPTAPDDRTGTDRLAERDDWTGTDGPLDVDPAAPWQDRQETGADTGEASDAAWRRTGRAGGDGGGPAGEGWEPSLARPTTLREHLLVQVAEELTEPTERLIGAHLVDWVDEAGYLAGTVEEIAAALGCSPARVEAVLTVLQRFDPAGVFARSLKECLALQLTARRRLDPEMAGLLDHLDLLARGDLATLAARLDVDRAMLAEMVAELRTLDPKPAWGFAAETVQTLIPDILMRPVEGGWTVELNAETLPRVLVNRRYHATVAGHLKSRRDKEYLAERLQSASWLTRALDQRANTILKVASEIVRQQQAFFRHGIDHLRPLVLRDVAQAIAMHESTVSRVTSHKVIGTPRGVFELKYFFTAAIGGTDGATHSAETVRARIRSLIDRETATTVLSDDRIVDILRADGIDIARRTVAKYRENLGIGSSVQRRRAKALSA